MPTPEILAAIGPENDIPIQHLLPDPLFIVAGKPKHFLASPACTGSGLLVDSIIRQSLPPFFAPNTIERFVVSNGNPALIPVNVPNPQAPGAAPQRTFRPIARRATIITLDRPVDKTMLLTLLLRGNADPAVHDLYKRTEGKNEYYDVTPEAENAIPVRIAFGMIDENTIVIVEGNEDDIKSVFSDATVPNNAILARLKHTPITENDLTVVTSLEGLEISPEELEKLLGQNGQSSLPPGVAAVIKDHLRAMSLSLNSSAAVGQPILTIYIEGRDENGAKAIEETVGGLLLMWQTTLAAMSNDEKRMLPIPHDFAAALLNAMAVKVDGTHVNVILNNYALLIPTAAELLNDFQTFELQKLRLEKMAILAERCDAYCREHQKFPGDILDAEGKPLLSWRVAMLPILGMNDLYNKFKLDEPWDSDMNKKLLEEIPLIYQQLAVSTGLTKSTIRYFTSAGTPFSKRDLTIEDVKFPEKTILFVDVAPQYAVEWTKPELLDFDIDKVDDLFGNLILGVTFFGQTIVYPVLPKTDPNYEKWKQSVQALIYGL